MEDEMTITATVIVKINQKELEKFNAKAHRSGRAARTAQDFVETGIANGLQHHFVTADYLMVITHE